MNWPLEKKNDFSHSDEGDLRTVTTIQLANTAGYTFCNSLTFPVSALKGMQSCSHPQEGGKGCAAVSGRDFASHTEHKAHHCSADLAHNQSMEWTAEIQLRKRQLQLGFN